MLKDRNIAFFIDIDGLKLRTEHYETAVSQLESMGTILFGKLYGCGERKHKAICREADLKGYKLERVRRVKRRGRREFDNRIFVDVVDTVCSAPALDAVCIASPACDMVYLYSYLRGRGIKIIALDNADDASMSFVDEILELGIVLDPKPTYASKPRGEGSGERKPSTAELLREIARLRALLAAQEEHTPVREQYTVEEDDMPSAFDRIAAQEIREEPVVENTEYTPIQTVTDDVREEEPASPVQEEPQAEEETETTLTEDNNIDEAKELLERYYAVASGEETEDGVNPASGPRASYSPQNDSDLIRKIEEIRNNDKSDLPEDLADQIRKLLEGIE